MTGADRTFPIRLDDRITAIPWAMLEPHEPQAYRNHSQSLVRLAARGGLTPEEAVAILENRGWERMTSTYSVLRLKELVDLWSLNELPTIAEQYPNGTPYEQGVRRREAATRGVGILERMRDGHTPPHRGLYNELIAILEACK